MISNKLLKTIMINDWLMGSLVISDWSVGTMVISGRSFCDQWWLVTGGWEEWWLMTGFGEEWSMMGCWEQWWSVIVFCEQSWLVTVFWEEWWSVTGGLFTMVISNCFLWTVLISDWFSGRMINDWSLKTMVTSDCWLWRILISDWMLGTTVITIVTGCLQHSLAQGQVSQVSRTSGYLTEPSFPTWATSSCVVSQRATVDWDNKLPYPGYKTKICYKKE